jgi:hypothetical protein
MPDEVGDWEGYVGVGEGVGEVVESLCWCVLSLIEVVSLL